MFQRLEALGAEAVGRSSLSGDGPTAAAAQEPTGTALGTAAAGGPAGGGVEPTHKSPAGPEFPEGQGPPGWVTGR